MLCPMTLSDPQIVDFVHAKSGWIESKLKINANKTHASSQVITEGSAVFSWTKTDPTAIRAEWTAITIDQDQLILQARNQS